MKKFILKNVLILVFSILFVFFTNYIAHAQLNNEDVSMAVYPANPKPGDTIRANLNSHTIDLNKTNIVWSVNNETLLFGIGKKNFSFTMSGDASSIISVSVETLDGKTIKKELTLSSSSIDLLWEAPDSYRPPFYKGKTLGVKEGTFKIVAMPSGGENSNNFSYNWIKNDNPQTFASGFGKNSFTFKNSYLNDVDEIKVNVSSINDLFKTTSTINLEGVNPKIIFYENNDNFGIKFERALQNDFFIEKKGSSIMMAPYFFSPKDIKKSNIVDIKWFVGEKELTNNEERNILNIKPDENTSGSSTVKVIINNIRSLFLEAEKQINVSF